MKVPDPIPVDERPSFLDLSMNHPLTLQKDSIAEVPQLETVAPKPSPSSIKPQNCRILIIDDEPFNLQALDVIIKCLKINGLHSIIDSAHSGSIALKKLEEGI